MKSQYGRYYINEKLIVIKWMFDMANNSNKLIDDVLSIILTWLINSFFYIFWYFF